MIQSLIFSEAAFLVSPTLNRAGESRWEHQQLFQARVEWIWRHRRQWYIPGVVISVVCDAKRKRKNHEKRHNREFRHRHTAVIYLWTIMVSQQDGLLSTATETTGSPTKKHGCLVATTNTTANSASSGWETLSQPTGMEILSGLRRQYLDAVWLKRMHLYIMLEVAWVEEVLNNITFEWHASIMRLQQSDTAVVVRCICPNPQS